MVALLKEQGFTLVELLVSMAIFAFGVLAVVNMQYVSTTTNLKSRHVTEGAVIAQSKVEELMGLDYDDALLEETVVDGDLDSGSGSTIGKTITEELDTTDHQDYADPLYKLGWNVKPDYPFNDTKTVRVIVKWTDKGIKKNFSLDLVKSRGD